MRKYKLTIGSPNVVRAFPGAEGMGADSIGGRSASATVYIVSNLNDSGTGSFRAAVTASGPRIVVFSVAGYINLNSRIDITNDNLTVFGQTSPGGICITGYSVQVRADHVTMRYLRFRRGSHKGTSTDFETYGESLYISDAKNWIFDHCSITHGTDETLQIGTFSGYVYGGTMSWCLIGYGLDDVHPSGNHAYAFNHTDKFFNTHPLEIRPESTVHHCYIMHSRDREPQYRGRILAEFTNNVVYNWRGWNGPSVMTSPVAGYTDDVPRINIINNYFKRGTEGNDVGSYGYFVTNETNPVAAQYDSFYTSGNDGLNTGTGVTGDWCVAEYGTSALADTNLQRSTAWNIQTTAQIGGVAVTATTMNATYAASVLTTVGASDNRDSFDQDMIDDFTNGTGTYVSDVTYPTDYPTLTDAGAPTDTNNDGIPDSWDENYSGTNPYGFDSSVNDATDIHSSGYAYIELYANGLV